MQFVGETSLIKTKNARYVHLFCAGPSTARRLAVTRMFQEGIELNWLPPTEPNGEVHYVIYYTPEGGTEQSIDTGSNLTHYNLTGLERNRVYTNIAVQAVNSAGRSGRSAVIARYNHTPLGGYWHTSLFMHVYITPSVMLDHTIDFQDFRNACF